ncbi:Integrin beta-nu [Eufriesea mexicana]|uniref:Integrin beta n=2 Tax=Eufriesea mexicana TaxID=516756 RepID=A0A310SFX4_9HYME|nr:Integrin beta-nu [Eufriesea mexicana]
MRIFESLLFTIFLCHEWGESDTIETKILRLCVSQNTCENCLQASSSCAWCSDWSYSNLTIGRPRCNVPKRLEEFGCAPEEIRTTPPGLMMLLEDSNFQDMEADRIPIQLRPQKVKIKISPHSEITIPVRYRLAKNYPLDLYYLMDLTWSMRDDKDTLVSLGWDMSQTLDKFTTNFRLGFGSYADKPLMPFIFPGHEDNPCKSEHAVCSPIYSYWHHLKLTNDIQRFIVEVNDSLVTGNVDNLEGALDGIVQAIVCTEEVDWAHQARKIILVATDGQLHFAGDGKLGGAVKRQDFKCHLDERGQYSLATKFDYPSLAELSRLLQEHKINLIFAVTENKLDEYEETAKLLKEKARVATLTNDSSNILEIIERAYHEITSKVILHDNSSSPLQIKYFSNCGKENVSEWSTSECDDINEGQVYDFKVVLSFDECPRDESLWKQTVVIEDALASQVSKIIIDVELLCGCNCRDTESSHCQYGTNECGLCKCDFGWSGEMCDCDESSPVNNVQQCIEGSSTKICSDRGECVCGKCLCDEGYKGAFCECSACDKVDGIECGNKGTCQCGVCQCIEGWSGNACQCPTTDELCIVPGSQEVCAGHGYCDCGECRCNVTTADGFYYRGTYCESSTGAGGSGLCVLYNPCVNATIEDPDKVDEFCQTNNTTYNTEKVKSIDTGNEHYCFVKTVKDKTTCLIHYIYEFQKNNIVTLKIGDKVCQTVMHVAVIPSAIVIGIVCFGLICLLIWKFWTSIQDKKEYEKFVLEQKKTVFSLNENPLFKPATSEFKVPSVYKED